MQKKDNDEIVEGAEQQQPSDNAIQAESAEQQPQAEQVYSTQMHSDPKYTIKWTETGTDHRKAVTFGSIFDQSTRPFLNLEACKFMAMVRGIIMLLAYIANILKFWLINKLEIDLASGVTSSQSSLADFSSTGRATNFPQSDRGGGITIRSISYSAVGPRMKFEDDGKFKVEDDFTMEEMEARTKKIFLPRALAQNVFSWLNFLICWHFTLPTLYIFLGAQLNIIAAVIENALRSKHLKICFEQNSRAAQSDAAGHELEANQA